MDAKNSKKKWAARRESLGRAWYRYSRNKLSVFGLIVVLAVIFIALFAEYIVPYPLHAGAFVDLGQAGLPPGDGHLLGTDQYGRDIFSRILFSFRGALLMGFGVLAVTVPVGVVLGLIAGYFQDSIVQPLIMRTVDIFLALPPLVLALAVSAVLKPTLFNSLMAVSFAWWAWYTRLTYSMASSLRNEFYIQSAELIGSGKIHILVREILPNCMEIGRAHV